MKKFSYLFSYQAKLVNGEVIFGDIHIKSEKKLSYKDMGLVRLEIIKENLNDNLNVRTVVITSIFYFGKVRVKENYNQNRGDVFSSNFIPTEGE